MTGQIIINKARRITNTDTATYTDADALLDLGYAYAEVWMHILRVRGDYNFGIEVARGSLMAYVDLAEGDNGYNGEYAWPTDCLKPRRVELKYSSAGILTPTKFYDLGEYDGSEHTPSQLNTDFTTAEPYVRFERESYFVRPLPTETVINGIYIEYEKRQTSIGLTDSPALEENLHHILAYAMALQYFEKYPDQYNPKIEQRYLTLLGMVEEFYKNREKRTLQMRPKFVSYE